MTRDNYEKARQKIISQKRSLIMQIRQWRNRRPAYADKLQAEYDKLQTPAALPPIFGFEITDDTGSYAGFTRDEIKAQECAKACNGVTKRRIAQNTGSLSI